MEKESKVILVNEKDEEIGTCPKLQAHKEGRLHRAFSIFIFNSQNELLLQQRANGKYHSGWLWTNTVCSHPWPGEDMIVSAKTRLMEEMGFSTDVKELFSFLYRSDYENGLSEHEFDHVLIGHYDNTPVPNPDEVMDYEWMSIDNVKKDIERSPEKYTSWFKLILENQEFLERIKSRKPNIKNKIINIIGQLRIYSLLDLVLFAYAIGSGRLQWAGIVLLHISFLFYLEYTHKHPYRFQIPRYIWMVIGILGMLLYYNLAAFGFLVASMLYVRKDQPMLSPFAPIARGFQSYFLAAGILGFLHPVSFLSFIVLTLRNFAGDLRDVVKDKKEGMNTLPIFLGFQKSYKSIHLICLFATSFIWWYISWLSIIWLIGIYSAQYVTYNITTR